MMSGMTARRPSLCSRGSCPSALMSTPSSRFSGASLSWKMFDLTTHTLKHGLIFIKFCDEPAFDGTLEKNIGVKWLHYNTIVYGHSCEKPQNADHVVG